jgi:hypothetical protein
MIAPGESRALADLKARLAVPKLRLGVQRSLHLDDDDSAMAALSAIQRITDRRLREHVETRLLFRNNLSRLNVSLMPQSLLGALWLQFAAAIDALKTFTKCQQCSAPFELSRDPRTGKRRDAQFCSARCRVGHYRARVERARRLKSTGMSVQKIARELDTQAGTVRGWVKQAEAGRAK